MTTQGPLSGGTFADDSSVGTIAWTNVSNAASSNNVYADTGGAWAFGSGASSHYLRATNFGFTIPSGANIDGVVVGIERKASATGTFRDVSCKLYTGSFVGSEKATGTNWPTTDTYEDHGGTTDVWGVALTDTIVNASSFGVGIAATKIGSGAEETTIDHIRITISYTVAPGGGSALSQTIVVGL